MTEILTKDIKLPESIRETSIPGLLIVERKINRDERGFFREVFRLSELKQATGIDFTGQQWNHSRSEANVLRGLHIEPWNKLVYPVNEKVFAAIADLRDDSSTFGKVETFTIDDVHRFALFVPIGCANSFCVISDKPVDYMYLVDKEWQPGKIAIAWDDPDLNIPWPIKKPSLSPDDGKNPKLREMPQFKERFK